MGRPYNSHMTPETAASYLCLAFTLDRKEALPILQANFPVVHRALSDGSLPLEAWRKLERHLPWPEWRRTWDRCERLRRRAVEMAARAGGTLEDVTFEADDETIQRVVLTCLATETGTRLLLGRKGGLFVRE